MLNNKEIIIQLGPFEQESGNNYYEEFPHWIKSELTLYRFKTGWLIFEPGTDNATQINGFILISQDETEMSLYHCWGD
jgi:hypothetical protein